MEKIEYKIAMVEQKTPYLKTIKCDRCGKIVGRIYCGEFRMNRKYKDLSYYHVVTGHNDWGNDSIDSLESKDICPSCLINEYSDYVDRSTGWNNTQYINIEHRRGMIEKEEEDGSSNS